MNSLPRRKRRHGCGRRSEPGARGARPLGRCCRSCRSDGAAGVRVCAPRRRGHPHPRRKVLSGAPMLPCSETAACGQNGDMATRAALEKQTREGQTAALPPASSGKGGRPQLAHTVACAGGPAPPPGRHTCPRTRSRAAQESPPSAAGGVLRDRLLRGCPVRPAREKVAGLRHSRKADLRPVTDALPGTSPCVQLHLRERLRSRQKYRSHHLKITG